MPADSIPLEAYDAAPYVGRRRSAVLEQVLDASAPVHQHDALDTGNIDRVLASLEPADQSTSFAHEPTTRLPMLRVEPPAPPSTGKRRAVKQPGGGRSPLLRAVPSAPVLAGVAALAVAVGGAVTVDDTTPAASTSESVQAATALSGTGGQARVGGRGSVTTRSADRVTQGGAASTEKQLKDAADALVAQRPGALQTLTSQADSRAKVIAADLWVYPLAPVILTARFGQYGLWSSFHTGLDFNGETGDQIHAIANGTVTFTGYDGSYGNKTVVTLDDGTELWYCHQSAIDVSVGDEVKQNQIIGLVGATGHVTGSHLHVEVRPGGGDPVDPYPAMQQHGLFQGSEAQ